MQLAQPDFFKRSATWSDAITNRPSPGDTGWKLACIASIFPLAAIFHHGVFWPANCMLNPFGHDYTLQVLSLWLANDPSLPLAALAALAGYLLGNRVRGLRKFLAPFLIAFAPLALWVWDIPFTERIVCTLWHDNRVILAEGIPLKGRHFYILGVAIYSALMLRGLRGGVGAELLEPVRGNADRVPAW
jgi:hypothetical protein